MHDQATFCRICAAACGAVVTVDGGQVVEVRGDRDHPVSHGYLCPKGRALGDWHHHPARLDRPRLRGVDSDWAAVLDDLGRELSAIRRIDPQRIGMYLATGFAYDSAGQVAAGQWIGAVGSGSFYSAATVDNAPVLVAAEMIAGHPQANPLWDPSRPGLLVLVGTNPVVSHGYGTTLPDPIGQLRRFRAGGGRVWVLDPRRSETAHHGDVHLALRPGSDVEVLGYLAAQVLAVGSGQVDTDDHAALRAALATFSVDRAAEASGVGPHELDQLGDEIVAARGNVAMLLGTGVTMAADGILAEWLRWVLLAATDSLDVPTGMRFHRGVVNRLRPPRPAPAAPGPASRPDLRRVAGQLPAVALADEIEAGNLRALVVVGGNPIAAFPEADRVRAALARLDVLAVVDVVDNELTSMATHVLAATGQLERADLTLAEHVGLRPGLSATRAVLAPGGERRPSWWILSSLARAMGLDLLSGADPDALDDVAFLSGLLARSPIDAADVWAAGPHGIEMTVDHDWMRSTLVPEGRWRLAPPELLDRLAARRDRRSAPFVLVPRRSVGWSNSVAYQDDGAGTPVHLHPDDAGRLGLTDGAAVQVRSRHGMVAGTVRLDPSSAPGTVVVPHGRPSPVGVLTSGIDGVDPLTGMPVASGLAVEVIAAGGPG